MPHHAVSTPLMLSRENSPHHTVSVSSTPSCNCATSRCLHVIHTPHSHDYTTSHCVHVIRVTTFLLHTLACCMPAPVMNHASSCGLHMIQSRNDATPRCSYLHHVAQEHVGIKPFYNFLYTTHTCHNPNQYNHNIQSSNIIQTCFNSLAIDLCLSHINHQHIYHMYKCIYIYIYRQNNYMYAYRYM